MRLVVRHPAPVVRVPRGGRVPALAFEALETPVEIPEADPGELDPGTAWGALVGALGLEYEVVGREGVLWRPLHVEDGRDRMPAEPLRPDGLARAFSPGGEPRLGDAILRGLGGTPLLARWTRPGPNRERVIEHARGLPPDRLGTLVEEERARSRAALAAFCAGELLATRDGVFRRTRPLATRSSGLHPVAHLCSMDPDDLVPVPIRADRYRDAVGFWRDGSVLAARFRDEDHPDGFCDDGDLDMLANAAPAFLRGIARACVRRSAPGGAAAPLPAVAALERWEWRGRIGAAGGEDRERVLRIAADACTQIRRGFPEAADPWEEWGGLGRFETYLRAMALPRLQPPLSEDDLDAMAGLAP